MFWAFLFLVGVWASAEFGKQSGQADDQRIVIDEVVGLGLTSLWASTHWSGLLAAFLLFRIFDIGKFPPVRQVDQWSKTLKHPYAQGFGVMIDDVLAALQAFLIMALLFKQGWIQ